MAISSVPTASTMGVFTIIADFCFFFPFFVVCEQGLENSSKGARNQGDANQSRKQTGQGLQKREVRVCE